MKFQGNTRTSLFARMSLLFGLLVTVPLVISGIVLSLAGRNAIVTNGAEVADIGRQRLERTADRFKQVARGTLDEAANKVAEEGRRHLDTTSVDAINAGKKALKTHTEQMTGRAERAVKGAAGGLVRVSEGALESSLTRLGQLNQKSRRDLSDSFAAQMDQELDTTSKSSVREALEKSVFRSWQVAADNRAVSVQNQAFRAVANMKLRLQTALGLTAIVRAGDEGLIKLHLNRSIMKNQPVMRAVLVSETGTELARVPDTDLGAGEAAPDWAESPTRKALMEQTDPVLQEPIRYDERSKSWIRRITHKVLDPSEEAPAPRPEMAVKPGEGAPLPPTMFLVVDLQMDNIVETATLEKLPEGMQVMVLHVEPRSDAESPITGRVVSSSDPKAIPSNSIAQNVINQLPKSRDESGAYAAKEFPFEYTTGDGTVMNGTARYWGKEDNCWTVVIQPRDVIRRPVEEFDKGIKAAWRGALNNVMTGMAQFNQKQDEKSGDIRNELLRDAQRKMEATEAAQMARVRAELKEYQVASASRLDRELEARKKALQEGPRQEIQRKAGLLAHEAFIGFGREAANETTLAATDIGVSANRVANRTAGQMLKYSGWLIPLFLVLALFLATMTARSLVRPINQLVKGTQALAAGEYNQRIKVKGDDELARLALAFNEMASAIALGQSELRQSHDTLAAEKHRIEAIVDASPDGLVMLEPSGEVAFINPTAVRLLELPLKTLPPAPFDLAQLPELAGQRIQECLEKAGEGEGVQEYEITEPQRVILQLREVPLRSGSGRLHGRLLHLHDVTRERLIDEMKTDFISLVSHELRTPLTSILGFSSYMLTGRMGSLSELQTTAMDSINRQAKRLSAIISDFLDVSRIESGKIEMRKQAVQVEQIAARVLEDLRPQATEKSIRVSTQVEGETQALVALGDEQRIAQVFTNLVGNALKFTESEGAIDILLSQQNGDVLCRVRDTGCGIPADELDRVFDRFYQVEKVVIRKSGGTGLGLAIVKNIVEAHGGRIWIESRVGEGTLVSFTLPRPV